MNFDSFYTKGYSHEVCQDYAYHGDTWAALSDGCSSSKLTDVGARLLVHSVPLTNQVQYVAEIASGYATGLRLPDEAMDATLSILRKSQKWPEQEEGLVSHEAGDGVRVLVTASGFVFASTCENDQNAPLYPTYLLSSDKSQRYFQYVKTERRITYSKDKTGSWMQSILEVRNDLMPWQEYYPKTEAGVYHLHFSDGIKAMVGPDGTVVPLTQVLDEFLQFKNFTGRFVVRRTKRFLQDCEKKGWRPFDDLSVIGVYLGSE